MWTLCSLSCYSFGYSYLCLFQHKLRLQFKFSSFPWGKSSNPFLDPFIFRFSNFPFLSIRFLLFLSGICLEILNSVLFSFFDSFSPCFFVRQLLLESTYGSSFLILLGIFFLFMGSIDSGFIVLLICISGCFIKERSWEFYDARIIINRKICSKIWWVEVYWDSGHCSQMKSKSYFFFIFFNLSAGFLKRRKKKIVIFHAL